MVTVALRSNDEDGNREQVKSASMSHIDAETSRGVLCDVGSTQY
jgi:hypothetical protein